MNLNNNWSKKLNSLSEIPHGKYEGYYWMSNDKKAIIIDGNFDFTKIQNNPFIIEGMLWDNDQNISIMIMHTGQYNISQYNIKELPNTFDKCYLAHGIDGVKKVKFKQIWLPEPDPFCNDMDVLKLKAIVFTGFKTNSHG